MGMEARDGSAVPPAGAPHGTTAAIGAFRNKWRFVRRHRGGKQAAFPILTTVLLVAAALIQSTPAASAAEYLVTSRIESSSGPVLVPTISVGAGTDAALGFQDGAVEYLLTVLTGDGSKETTHSAELRVTEVGKSGKKTCLTTPRLVLDSDGVGEVKVGDRRFRVKVGPFEGRK